MRAGHAARLGLRRERAGRQARGIGERRQRVIARIDLDKLAVPVWALIKAVRGLSFRAGPIGSSSGVEGEKEYVWLPLRLARLLAALDREEGGMPIVTEAEFRYCDRCGRPLLGEDAASRRKQLLSGATANELPCGETCVAAQRDRRWKAAA